VSLLRGRPSDGRTSDAERVLRGDDGRPVAQAQLSPGVAVWVGDQEISERSPPQISWWFQFRTGVPLAEDKGRLSLNAVGVGTPRRPLTAVWGIAGNDVEPLVVAPEIDGVPGLSVRTVDNRIRRAIALYSSGFIDSREF
jgi:hypothetical protein